MGIPILHNFAIFLTLSWSVGTMSCKNKINAAINHTLMHAHTHICTTHTRAHTHTYIHTHTHTYTHPYYGLLGFCPGLPG